MSKSKIEWCDRTWNPITGCTKISPGCENCYAERMAKRFGGSRGYADGEHFKVRKANGDTLFRPLRWKRPSKIFVGSMTDLFHEDVKDEWLDEIFGMMLAQHVFTNGANHTFMVLTKRPERMKEYFSKEPKELLKRWALAAPVRTDNEDILFAELVESECHRDWDEAGRNSKGSEAVPWGYCERLFPLPNLWLGVTAENQEQADKRIPTLLETEAAYRFVSVEPMLGPVNLDFDVYWLPQCDSDEDWPIQVLNALNWVICGGESGRGARPMSIDWVRDLKEQCNGYSTPFFFKQWGEHDSTGKRVGKNVAGRLLDGEEVMEWPETLKPI